MSTSSNFFQFSVFASAAVPMFAQFETATVLGAIIDSSAASSPGVRVPLKNVATGVEATTVSDDNGNFEFFDVRIGR